MILKRQTTHTKGENIDSTLPLHASEDFSAHIRLLSTNNHRYLDHTRDLSPASIGRSESLPCVHRQHSLEVALLEVAG